MADKTKIEWTDATWNPIRGCARVSEGCVHCYAETMAARFCGPGQPYEGVIDPRTKRWNNRIRIVPEMLTQPLRWQRPRRIFVNSMSDLFHENLQPAFRAEIFSEMRRADWHTYQVLTKRAQGMRDWIRQQLAIGRWREAPRHVWLGVSVENQQTADERIPLLLDTPAAIRWLSMEPLLGPVAIPDEQLQQLQWVVVGGESGKGARMMRPEWARQLRDDCVRLGVPFHFKQWGEHRLLGNGMVTKGKRNNGRDLDGRTWDQWPDQVADDGGRADG